MARKAADVLQKAFMSLLSSEEGDADAAAAGRKDAEKEVDSVAKEDVKSDHENDEGGALDVTEDRDKGEGGFDIISVLRLKMMLG